MSIEIIKKTSTYNTTPASGRKISYIVIHYTAGVTSKKGSARNVAGYFANPSVEASADFIVDDGEIIQYNPDIKNRYCWSVGGSRLSTKGGSLYGRAGNCNTVNIEICSSNTAGRITSANDKYFYFTDAAAANAVKLTKYLMGKYGIPADHVIRHYDVTGKLCPGVRGWNADSGDESRWKAFKAALGGAVSTSAVRTAAKAENKSSGPDIEYCVYSGGRWLPYVKNLEDYAGLGGIPVQGVRMKVSRGKVRYRVRLLGSRSYLPWVTGDSDYAGIIGRNIDCIQAELTGADGYVIRYRVRTNGSKNYLPWVKGFNNKNADGYAGIPGLTIDALQAEIVKK